MMTSLHNIIGMVFTMVLIIHGLIVFLNRNLLEMNGDRLWKQWKKLSNWRSKSTDVSWNCMLLVLIALILR